MNNMIKKLFAWINKPISEELFRFKIDNFLDVKKVNENSSMVYLKDGTSKLVPIPKDMIVAALNE